MKLTLSIAIVSRYLPICIMFSRQCSRLVTSKTAIPLTSYFARVNRPYSSAASTYEHILTETPKPGVGLSMSNEPIDTMYAMD